MFEIAMDTRYKWFIRTICACATPVYPPSDEEFMSILFEDLSIDVFSVFSEKNLDDLSSIGRISPEDKKSCLWIRELFKMNEDRWRGLGDAEKIRKDPALLEMWQVADKLRKLYSGYALLDEETNDTLWEKIYREYQFVPKYEKKPYPWIRLPMPCRAFSLPHKIWNEDQETMVNSFFVQLGISTLNVLDWQHDCFSFNPVDYGRLVRYYYDVDRNCNVYFPSFFPNGDYHFFVDPEGKYAVYGHPWIGEIVVCGQELINCFEANRKELALGNQGG